MVGLREAFYNVIYFPADVILRIVFFIKKVKFPKKSKVRGKLYLYNRGKIEIGDGCTMYGANKFNAIGFCGICNIVATRGAKIIIGKNFGMSGATLYSRSSITIGDNVMLGGGVKVYDTDFHSINHEFRGKALDRENTKNEAVVIEDDVFIGAGSIVLKGVHIGKRSVIGAGSVVTKDIPQDEIWAGNPAKFIRKI